MGGINVNYTAINKLVHISVVFAFGHLSVLYAWRNFPKLLCSKYRVDSADVARCRLAWRAFDAVSPDLRSINLLWSMQRYIASRSMASTSSQLTSSPFKEILLNLVSNLRVVESVRISAENLPLNPSNGETGENADDLYLTDGAFVEEWLPKVSRGLKSLSITDFWVQPGWRRSNVLSLVSAYCQILAELELKNAWLSVEKLNPMPMLTSLTLEFIRLDDKALSQLNECFPNLEVLNLRDVRGPMIAIIRHLKLKTCHWTATDAPKALSLITPNLITLRLECIRPIAIYIEAPMLSHLHLVLVHVGVFAVKDLKNVKTLWLETSHIPSLLDKLPLTDSVENLTLDSRDSGRVGATGDSKLTLNSLYISFPSLSGICFKSRAWSEIELWHDLFRGDRWDRRKRLKTFRGYFLRVDPSLNFSLVGYVLEQCVNLVEVSLLIHRDVGAHVSRGFISRCMARWPKVEWRLGMWEEEMEDSWISI